MQFYNTNYSKTEDTLRPQFEVKDNKVYATIYNKEATGNRALPWYEIKGNNIHTTAYNPKGHDVRPMYEIRGDAVHTTLHNPSYSHTPIFTIKH